MLMITNIEAQMGIYLKEKNKLVRIAEHLGLSSKYGMLPKICFSYAVYIYIHTLKVYDISKD